MNQSTKQRVVGTFVLLALALIFLPLVLDGDGNYKPTISSRIPDTPIIDFMPEPEPERPVIDADRFQSQSAVAVAPTATVSVDEQQLQDAEQVTIDPGLVSAEPKLDELSLPEGWSVRLGVFSDSANAVSLTRRLLDAGYRAYSRDIPGAQGVATGVFVGPHVDRGEANLLKDRLQDEFQLAGLVVRFEVDSI